MTTTHDAGDLWALAHTERAALAADLAGLTDAQWATPSLCTRWSVEDVVAHLTAAASIGPLRWLRSVLGARLDFDLHNDRRLAEQRATTPGGTLARFRAITASTTATMGPTAAWLAEDVVHAADIRRPVGIPTAPSVAATTEVARFFARRDFTVAGKTVSAGLRLEATDGPFATGDGRRVTGTTHALVMVMAGRPAFLDDLDGPGVATLRERQSRK